MWLYAVIAVLLVVAVLSVIPAMRRRNTRLDEVDRFHVARSLTTGWADSTLHVPVSEQEPVD